LYVSSKHWMVSNLIAFSFCIVALRTIKLDHLVTGMVLLSALFVYDIFWVFQLPVMETVARGLDYPIKLLFPRVFVFSMDRMMDTKDFAMLGLGDIVIPGFFIASCLRYDMHHQLHKRYFFVCMVFYALGLSSAMVASQYYQTAQPALLYISPSCILSVLGLSWYRGEWKQVMAFSAIPKSQSKVETGSRKDPTTSIDHQEPTPTRSNSLGTPQNIDSPRRSTRVVRPRS
jgi:minor histocompatibility antigen H13